MAVVADQFVELGAVDWFDLYTGGFGLLKQGLRSGVAAILAEK
jgi:hypothetical protein